MQPIFRVSPKLATVPENFSDRYQPKWLSRLLFDGMVTKAPADALVFGVRAVFKITTWQDSPPRSSLACGALQIESQSALKLDYLPPSS